MKALFRAFCNLAVGLFAVHAQSAATFTSLWSFDQTNGADPESGLVTGPDGNFYGTTTEVGGNTNGTIFRINLAGNFTNIFSFNGTNGARPRSNLLIGKNGLLYGTSYIGGSDNGGVLFQIDTNASLTPLHSFSYDTGSLPLGGLIQDQMGNLYGTTVLGGTNSGGTAFEFTTNSSFQSLASFSLGVPSGNSPYSGLLQGSDGAFYGTTDLGGTNDYGTIYKIDTNGTLTTLVSFNYTNGAHPYAGLIYGPDGNLYGSTFGGGSNGYGTVFKLDSLGTLTTLVSFNNTNGASPQAALLLGQDGNFYGTTSAGGDLASRASGHGTVFQMAANGELKTLFLFNGTNGDSPQGALIQDAQGNLYGTTASGGLNGLGTIFRLTLTTQPPQFLSIAANAQAVTLTWTATSQETYQVQYKTNLNQSLWLNLNSSLVATNSTMTTIDADASDPVRFYQILMLP